MSDERIVEVIAESLYGDPERDVDRMRPEPFDRDAATKALEWFDQEKGYLWQMLSDEAWVHVCRGFAAARWAVQVTEGDGIDELRERVARALHDSDPVSSPGTREDWDIHRAWYYSVADAVLRVVAEHLGGRDV